jgi:hypothetical protein
MRQPLAVKTSNRQIYQASKPKPTLPYQALRKLLTPPSPALRKQSISLQHSKVQKYKEDSPHHQWCHGCQLKSRTFKSQDLKDIKSCMVTLLLARTFYSIACSAFGVCSMAFIDLMLLGLRLRCREGIHSQQSTFHGATLFKKRSHAFMVSTQTQSEISNVI